MVQRLGELLRDYEQFREQLLEIDPDEALEQLAKRKRRIRQVARRGAT